LPILGTSLGVAVWTEHWKRCCENTFVVLDGDNMPNVCGNSTVLAIDPGERLHEHKSGCYTRICP
jgi:hypothetical protein